MIDNPKQCCKWFVGIVAIWLAVVAFLILFIDPFWIWRQNPPWLNHGRNLNLNVHMRLSKSLQVLSRPTDIVVTGASPVYHGFDLHEYGNAYNMGLAGLRVKEMEGFVTHLLRYKHVKQLIIGLDYRMFDSRHVSEPGYNEKMGGHGFLPETFLSSIYSWSSVKALKKVSNMKNPNKGVWQWNGFITSPSVMEVTQVQEAIDEIPEGFTDVEVDKAAYDAFERTIVLARSEGVEVSVYLTPLYKPQLDALDKYHARGRFEQWAKQVSVITRRNDASFYDLTHSPFTNDRELLKTGHSKYWTDPTHFSPLVGEWILQQLHIKKLALGKEGSVPY